MGLALHAALAALAGCGSDIVDLRGDHSSATGGGAGSVQAASVGPTSGAGGQGASSGAGGTPVAGPCGLGQPPVQDALCGPPDMPCVLLADELLPSPPSFRNDAPSIALDADCTPHVLFSVAESGYYGFYARRNGPDSWQVEPTPFALATAGLAISPAGVPLAVPNDGAFGASLWARAADGWSLVETVPAEVTHWANGVAQSTTGTIHTGFTTSMYTLELGTYSNHWKLSTLGEASAPVALALSPQGQPHVASWGTVGNEWVLFWYSPPSPPEPVVPYGPSALGSEGQHQRIAVTAADAGNSDGRPHLFATRTTGNGQDLVYATRSGPNAWMLIPVDQVFTGDSVYPLSIVAAPNGTIRMLYTKGSFSSSSQWEIFIAWTGVNQLVNKSLLATSTIPLGATAVRDGFGRIHIALYEHAAISEFNVRYMLFGP